MEIARALHQRSVHERTGVLEVTTREGVRRVGLLRGQVYAIDPGPHAPVSAESQLRYVLRQLGQPHFVEGARLSGRFAVDPLRPDASIRQHVEAQAMPHEPLRQRLGQQRFTAAATPHPSSLHADEQALVRYLAEPRSVTELLTGGAWSPLRALRLLVLLDALGCLAVGMRSAELAAAYGRLELSTDADLAEIRQAYRRLARGLHPDHHPHASTDEQRELTSRFAAVNTAYRLLLRHLSAT
jgi:hypothetical protein